MYMVNLEKYKNDGWGLSKKEFENLIDIITKFNTDEINIVEFGSGMSTVFLVDMINEGFKLNITSFDDNIKYAAKVKHEKLKLIITDLVDCNDSDFDNLFNYKLYDSSVFNKKTSEVHTRQKNTFYDININELPEKIDIMIVDGPHGNGRSIAFLHGINKLKKDSYVLIDDYNHYDFVDRFTAIYPNSELIYSSNTGSSNQWELGGNYVIYKIINNYE